ncbi:MAG: DNA mismatch repair endonuclease MutL [Candidatus Sericytochromatia bacterium]|nr:DNA mismatch repair endonuclease MutL [Candidatus Sericytochromatia bacterium]
MEVTPKTDHNLIKILSEEVSNQIAAGEVVERPSSVVKELVENSIDANATEIIVDIQNSGRSLKITDNGQGISPEQAELAFRRFATSKLRTESDLWSLSTMGFRGEALASIASIAKVEMKTRRRQDDQGTKINIHGSNTIGIEPVGVSYGTSINIDELFYNTPARLKFLKSDSTEVNHIIESMQTFALCHSNISFSVINKSREVIRTNGANSKIEDVVRILYGKEVSDNIINVDYENSYGRVTGVVSTQKYSRGDKNKQIFFINNRWVKIPFIHKMLDEIYTDLLPSHRHPFAVLKIEIPPNEIDINVHPTKKEVRFHSYSSVYELVYRGIINCLYPKRNDNDDNSGIVYLDNPHLDTNSTIKESSANYAGNVQPVYPDRNNDNQKLNSDYNPSRYTTPPKEGTYQVQQFSFYDELRSYKHQEENREDLESIKPIGRIYEIYIIGYLGNDLCFIDQHLAHERYLYEQLELDVKSTQELLTTIMIQLTDSEWDNYSQNKDIFEQYGYEIQEFGNKTIIVRAIPSVLEVGEAENVFRNVLVEMINEEGRKKALDKFTHLKKTIACKAAIKAGKHLDMEEIKILVKNWAKTRQPYTCPHGRPVIYRLPKNDIDKHFNRTW